jgi:hypothetical protein
MSPPRISIKNRLQTYKVQDNGCWNFLGNKDKDGYGVFGHGRGKQLRAHRASFEFHKKTSAFGLLVCHSCDNPGCINPDHLFLGNPKDNTQDMIKKGRKANCQGSNHPSAKLNEIDVISIKEQRSLGKKLINIANQFGITFQTVSEICRGKTWKHL